MSLARSDTDILRSSMSVPAVGSGRLLGFDQEHCALLVPRRHPGSVFPVKTGGKSAMLTEERPHYAAALSRLWLPEA